MNDTAWILLKSSRAGRRGRLRLPPQARLSIYTHRNPPLRHIIFNTAATDLMQTHTGTSRSANIALNPSQRLLRLSLQPGKTGTHRLHLCRYLTKVSLGSDDYDTLTEAGFATGSVTRDRNEPNVFLVHY